MVRPFHQVGILCALCVLGCIGITDNPRGRFEIASWTVTPAGGEAQTVTDAGSLQIGGVLLCDTGAFAGSFDACGDDNDSAGVSILAYEWVGGGLVPLWAPTPAFFYFPEWDGKKDEWGGTIPLGNLSCVLRRDKQDPLILVGEGCGGPDGAPFAVELTMDR